MTLMIKLSFFTQYSYPLIQNLGKVTPPQHKRECNQIKLDTVNLVMNPQPKHWFVTPKSHRHIAWYLLVNYILHILASSWQMSEIKECFF